MRLLIITSAGLNSLHRSWLSPDLKKSVDLMLLDYEAIGDFENDARYYLRVKGLKFPNLVEAIKNFPEVFCSYDYYWLLDDDIRITPLQIEQFLTLCRQYRLRLATPALRYGGDGRRIWTQGLYCSHQIMIQRPNSEIRFTNFVEIMMPLFSQESFNMLRDSFAENQSGWGLDLLWAKRLNSEGMGIVDAVGVTHTRKLRTKALLDALDIDPADEMRNICKQYQVVYNPKCLKVVKLPAKAGCRKEPLVCAFWFTSIDILFHLRLKIIKYLAPYIRRARNQRW